MRRRLLAAAALGALAAACAPRVAPRVPEGEEYLYPAPRPGEASAEESRRLRAAWVHILAGDAAAGERELARVLARHRGFAPAETALAYARLRAGRFQEARDGFDAVLQEQPALVPALVGAGSAAFRLRDPDAALSYYRRAQSADPDEPAVRRRLPELKLQVTERRVAAAQAAIAAGDPARALNEYRSALDAAPEVAGVRLACAELLAQGGDLAGAADLLEADPSGDRQVGLKLGELAVALGQPARALQAYRRLLGRDAKDSEVQQRALEARQALELQGRPEEYKRIASAPRVTRADLAALIAVKVTALARAPGGEPDVAIDISGSWAREYILKALSLGILDVYPNHTFQPGAIARRSDLARAVARVLDLLGVPRGGAPAITDMSATNLYYDAAARAVAAGLMDLSGGGAFEPWRPVSGRDAADVIDGLARLVGP